MDPETLMKVLQQVKEMANGFKAKQLTSKYLKPSVGGDLGSNPEAAPDGDAPTGDEPDSDDAVEMKIDAPADELDDDKISQIVSMLGKK